MANVTSVEVEKEVVTVKKERRFILDLSESEALTLLALTGNILGSPTTTPRKHCDTIYELLRSRPEFSKFYSGDWFVPTESPQVALKFNPKFDFTPYLKD